MFKYLSLENFNFRSNIVGVRIDINSPIVDGKIVENERFLKHCKTIKHLLKERAKVVLLAHQGRKGKIDFLSLKAHGKILSNLLKVKVKFIPEVYSRNVIEEIENLQEGEVLLLENLRFLPDEDDPSRKDNKILKLENLFDCYVLDAFSVSHRNQTSMSAFSKIPIIAGDVMESEIRGLNLISETKSPHIFLLGGAKPDDLIDLIESSLKSESVDLILLSGVIGELALYIKGYYLGRKMLYLKEHHYTDAIDRLSFLLKKYSSRFVLPMDVAYSKDGKRFEIDVDKISLNESEVDENLIEDIGAKTVKKYMSYIRSSGSIYVKGPAGNFEKKEMGFGTKELFRGIVDCDSFSFMGGGHSVTAAKMFGTLNKFSYVSLAGGAVVKFLAGKKLPGIECLEKSYEKHLKEGEDFVVIGSNVMDISVSLPDHLDSLKLGDKIKINDNFKITVGGGGMNVSVCLSKLGAKVGYLGKISSESLEIIKGDLNTHRISLIESKVTNRACAKSILLDTDDKDRVVFYYQGHNSDLCMDDFEYKNINSKNFYFSSLTGESFNTLCKLAKLIKKDKDNSLICYNPSCYLIKEEKSKLKKLLTYCDIVVLNYDEAQSLVGEGTYFECLERIFNLKIRKVVVITDGGKGAYAYDGYKKYYQESLYVKGKIFATGAGDSFTGTFFYFFGKGYGIKKALYYGAKNSASVISKKGAQNGLVYYEDLIKE